MKTILTILILLASVTTYATSSIDSATDALKAGKVAYYQSDGTTLSPMKPFNNDQITVDQSVKKITKFQFQFPLPNGYSILANNVAGVVNTDKTITFDLAQINVLNASIKLTEKD